jgi:hypothetical protein
MKTDVSLYLIKHTEFISIVIINTNSEGIFKQYMKINLYFGEINIIWLKGYLDKLR